MTPGGRLRRFAGSAVVRKRARRALLCAAAAGLGVTATLPGAVVPPPSAAPTARPTPAEHGSHRAVTTSTVSSLGSGCQQITDSSSPSGLAVSCSYGAAGFAQTLTVPAGVPNVTVTLDGAQGGSNGTGEGIGGYGGQVVGSLAVSGGEQLQLDVGGQGAQTGSGSGGGGSDSGGSGAGGHNNGCGGGGGTEVLVGGSVVAAAGGGGGCGGYGSGANSNQGGAGGDPGAYGANNTNGSGNCPGNGGQNAVGGTGGSGESGGSCTSGQAAATEAVGTAAPTAARVAAVAAGTAASSPERSVVVAAAAAAGGPAVVVAAGAGSTAPVVVAAADRTDGAAPSARPARPAVRTPAAGRPPSSGTC